MIIPISEVKNETLTAIAEAYVLREGTEYGMEEYSLNEKVEQVLAQLKSGEALLMYSELHESVDIITRDQYELMQAEE
ncbi:YheU family protein [Alteromonadaceae bacterium M269]|nr:YheU family protein [Alteromonadaceae bacterium M269]